MSEKLCADRERPNSDVVFKSGVRAGQIDMQEKAAKFMEARARIIEGDGGTNVSRVMANIYREEAGNIRLIPVQPNPRSP